MTRSLADVVHVLTRPHATRNGDRVAYVEPLLDTLQSLIHPSSSAKGNDGGGGGGGSRPPISLDALTLWQDITGRIDRDWPYAGHPSAVRVPYGRKVQAWMNTAVTPEQQSKLYALCTKWEDQIREALEPAKRMPLSGACPECQNTHVETISEDGERKYNPTLLAFPGADPVTAICQVCGKTWQGGELHELAEIITR